LLGGTVCHHCLCHRDLFLEGGEEASAPQILAQGPETGASGGQGGQRAHRELLPARDTSDRHPCDEGYALAGVRSWPSSAWIIYPLLCAKTWQLGWRVYVTTQPPEQLSLQESVLAYRNEYLVERAMGRLKGRPLSLTPMYLERDDHA